MRYINEAITHCGACPCHVQDDGADGPEYRDKNNNSYACTYFGPQSDDAVDIPIRHIEDPAAGVPDFCPRAPTI